MPSKVYHFVDSLNVRKGGVTAYLLSLIRAMNAESPDLKFEVNYLDSKKDNTVFQNHPQISFHRQNMNLFNLFMTSQLASPNGIVHSHGLWLRTNFYARHFARKNNLKLMLSPHGMLEPWAMNSQKIKKKLAWTIYERQNFVEADIFHATSAMEAESIRRMGFKQPIAMIPVGVDTPVMETAASKPARKSILFLSRIDPKKGLERLFSIWQKQAQLFPDWELVIAGDGPADYVRRLKKLAHEQRLERVRWTGFVEDQAKAALFCEASLFVLPTFSENFGVAIGEALAWGIPVITTRGAPWKNIETFACGWYAENNEVAIEAALLQALRTPENDLRKMGQRGQRLIQEQYRWSDIARKMIETYRWILTKDTRPDWVRVDL